MARIENLMDSGKGTLGNLVLYKMKGKMYVRSRPERYRDRKSPAQLAQRLRLEVVAAFLRPFSGLLRTTYAGDDNRGWTWQAAQSYNMRNALTGEYPDISIDSTKALLSKGPLPLPANASVMAENGSLVIEWENGAEASGSALRDTLVVMAWFGKEGWGEYRFSGTFRSEGQFVWKPVQPVNEEDLPDVWIAFRNNQMTAMSNSMFVPAG